MHRPAHLTADEERRRDRLEDAAAALAALRGRRPRRPHRDRDLLPLLRPAAGRRALDGDDAEEIARHDRPHRGPREVRRPPAAAEVPPAAGRGRPAATRRSGKRHLKSQISNLHSQS